MADPQIYTWKHYIDGKNVWLPILYRKSAGDSKALGIHIDCCCPGCPTGCSVTKSFSSCYEPDVIQWVADNCKEEEHDAAECGSFIKSAPDEWCPGGTRWTGYCCAQGCPDCYGGETCTESPWNCLENDDPAPPDPPDPDEWYASYDDAFFAAEALGHIHCKDGECCYDGDPCFVVMCDEDSPHKVAGDCLKYFWQLCCECCDPCDEGTYFPPLVFDGDCVPCTETDARDTCKEGGAGGFPFPVGTFPEGCCEPCAAVDPRESCDTQFEGWLPEGCCPIGNCSVHGDTCPAAVAGNVCAVDRVGEGYCTAEDAEDGAAAAGLDECNGENCTDIFGCYYITCDDTKCKDRFNWVGCKCEEGCPDCADGETCISESCVGSDDCAVCVGGDPRATCAGRPVGAPPAGCVADWYPTYAAAKAAAEGAPNNHTHCVAGACCPDGDPCFIVGCYEDSPHNQPEDCKKYFWQLCCECCDDCGSLPTPPTFPEGCEPCEEFDARETCKNSFGWNLPVGTLPNGCTEVGGCAGFGDDCDTGYDCGVTRVGPGYCTSVKAAQGALASTGLSYCRTIAPFRCLDGCFYITCDPDKCEDKFNWVTCKCGCPDCTAYEVCSEFGCLENAVEDRHGWYDDYDAAFAAGEAAPGIHCGPATDGSDCCPGGEQPPCFIVGCDETDPNEDCKKYFWQFCCSCCDDCGILDAPPVFPEGCEPCELGDTRPKCSGYDPGEMPEGCFVAGDCSGSCVGGNDCYIDKVGEGYCTASIAAANVPDARPACNGDNCTDGCYYITCDITKCEDRFNWVMCKCQGTCPDCEDGETCTDVEFGCVEDDGPATKGVTWDGWWNNKADAKAAAEALGHFHCGAGGACCPFGNPCFVVGCDETQSDEDCKKYFWKLCCSCCDYCDADPIVCSDGTSCESKYGGDADCIYGGAHESGYCSVAALLAAADAPAMPACTGTNCTSPGCYIITCDDTLCEKRFNWFQCICDI